MLKSILFVFVLSSALVPVAQSQDSDPLYVKQWCHDVRDVLTSALALGRSMPSYAEELVVLNKGIQQAIDMSRPKQEMFAKQTLQASLVDAQLFKYDLQRKAEFLRFAITNAIDDLRFIDRYLDNKSDKGPYVSEILEDVLRLGQRLPENSQELIIESSVVRRAIALIDMSDNRRRPEYACARQVLYTGLSQSQDEDIGEPNRVLILRGAIHRAAKSLRNRNCRRD